MEGQAPSGKEKIMQKVNITLGELLTIVAPIQKIRVVEVDRNSQERELFNGKAVELKLSDRTVHTNLKAREVRLINIGADLPTDEEIKENETTELRKGTGAFALKVIVY